MAPRASTSIAQYLLMLNFKPTPADAPIRALALLSPSGTIVPSFLIVTFCDLATESIGPAKPYTSKKRLGLAPANRVDKFTIASM